MARAPQPLIRSEADLLAADDAVDRRICGTSLAGPETTRLAEQGAHDPTPTPYFVLDELFSHVAFDERTRLLDVGCGTGRVLAQAVRAGYPGTATGIELDAELAERARAWTARYPQLDVLQGDVRELDLSPFTVLYLFNPFDVNVLVAFIAQVEAQLSHPCTYIHMSDNGDSWHYRGRPGWTELASGTFQHYRNDRGFPVRIYEDPQHYTIWRFDPATL